MLSLLHSTPDFFYVKFAGRGIIALKGMDPITLPNDRKSIFVIHPRHKRRIKHAVGVILVAALFAAFVFNLAAPGGVLIDLA